jgi:hypothetical protein
LRSAELGDLALLQLALSTLDVAALQALKESCEELETRGAKLAEDIGDIGTFRCVRSERSVTTPAGRIVLPNGMTAIRERTWGHIKQSNWSMRPAHGSRDVDLISKVNPGIQLSPAVNLPGV